MNARVMSDVLSTASDDNVLARRRDLRRGAIAALLTLIGLIGFSAQFFILTQFWLHDALRSISVLIPPASAYLALQAWTRDDWRSGGNWWGLALMSAALGVALIQPLMPFNVLVSSAQFSGAINLVPIGVVFYVYFSGAVLLFGGTQAWRKAWFALLLWLFIDPVPHSFQNLVDLPLQAIGARTARGFAHVLSVPVTGDTLTLMFSEKLGIFIGAGCNGLRGATTMGYMALVIGYLYKLTRLRWAAFVLAAVALAYLFNLIRLCAIIGYYWFALRIPVLGHYGTEIDYLIGGTLFFCAAGFLLGIPRYAKPLAVST